MKKLKMWSAYIAIMLLAVMSLSPIASAASSNEREQAFQAAAAEFHVPVDVLKAISYNQSRWENHDGAPSTSGGFGLMHLTTAIASEDGRGDPDNPVKPRQPSVQIYTLDEASQLLGVNLKELEINDSQNIRGGAAVLAQYAQKTNGGQTPTDLKAWYGAVAHMSGATDAEAAQQLADNVYDTLKTGVSRTTTDGQTLGIAARLVEPDRSTILGLGLPQPFHGGMGGGGPECPPTITCKFVPARFAQNDPNDPTNYGNYDQANRPADMAIKYIVIHDTEGSYQSSIDWFQNPASFVSAHYVIRSSDGEVTQMVKDKDVAWHAGNWYVNMHSIGIEHEGFAAEGATWYTDAMYQSSAKLVRYLAEKYNIPLDREHIIGHEQFHAPRPTGVAAMHWDPGPYWDWDHYMNLLQHPVVVTGGAQSTAVTIAPRFQTNQPPVTQCGSDGTCTTLPQQPANFVYLRTQPNPTAPLLTDAGMHPGGEPGTTQIEDWSAKAFFGQRFAVAGQQGDWTAIWFSGQKGWFYNPSTDRTALPANAKLVKAKPGVSSVPVYGRPLPEPSAYPPGGAPVQTIIPLQYSIPAGQTYVAYDRETVNDYYHVLAFDRSTPGDGTVVVGHEKYIPIAYNHRQAYVKSSDVTRLFWQY